MEPFYGISVRLVVHEFVMDLAEKQKVNITVEVVLSYADRATSRRRFFADDMALVTDDRFRIVRSTFLDKEPAAERTEVPGSGP